MTIIFALIAGYYGLVTRRVLKAIEKAAEAMKGQTEAFVRPYITVTHVLTSDGTVYLNINNTGRTIAEDLTLEIDESFSQWAFGPAPHHDATDLQASLALLSNFPPGAVRTFLLKKANAGNPPTLFDITAKYTFAGKTVSERTTLDLRSNGRRAPETRLLEDQLAIIRKELAVMASELAELKQGYSDRDLMPTQRGGDEEIDISEEVKPAPLLEEPTEPKVVLVEDDEHTQWLTEELLENEFILAIIREKLAVMETDLELLKQGYFVRGLMGDQSGDDEVIGVSEEVKLAPLLEGMTKPKVLLVEDNEHTQYLIQVLLENEFDLTVVSSAEDALMAAIRTEYDIVLMDINLGVGADGKDVLRELRAMPTYQNVPIAAITAYALPGDQERFLKLGFTAYLPKPFTARELLVLMERLCCLTP